MAESDWELGSGFALDGATATVSDVEFTHDNALGPNVCAKFTFSDVVDTEGNEVDDAEQKFTVGKNYDNSKDGSELVGQGKINQNTNFGILLASIVGIFLEGESEEDVRAARAKASEVVPSPKEATSWVGTRWTLGTIEKSVLNPSTGKTRDDAKKFVFTEYHGRGDDDEAPASAAPAKKTTSTAKKVGGAKTAGTGSKTINDVDAELWTALVTLAGEHEDEDAFNDAALDLPEVEKSRPAQKAIMKGLVWAAKD